MKSIKEDLLLERSNSHSKPSAGKTMLSLLKKYGSDLHEAHSILMNDLQVALKNYSNQTWIKEVLLFKSFESNKELLEKEKSSLISTSLILNWICGRILNKIPPQSKLLDAEIWFQNFSAENTFSKHISIEVEENVLSYLRNLNIHLMLDELPYLTEVFETGNEIANEIGAGRTKKKSNGIYYTPTDVIDFIISHTIANSKLEDNSSSNTTWLDPALGTGSFLLSVLKNYESNNQRKSKPTAQFCTENLFGTDISPIALQSAAYILTTHCLLISEQESTKELALSIGNNLALVDATTISDKVTLGRLFPILGTEGVDFIVSNPPYSKKKQFELDLFHKPDFYTGSTGEDLYPYFVKLLLDLSKQPNGGGGMIVPLSLAASSKESFKNLRNYIQRKKGMSEFFNFDRTPDSLFGDDIKTRNTIFFFTHPKQSQQKEIINSTYLHRWNSRNRESLFHSISVATLHSQTDITNGIPKVGDNFGVRILNEIQNKNSGTLSEILKPTQESPEIITRTTAYNWIPTELRLGNSKLNSTGCTFWQLRSNEISPPMVYALLNSRISYWLWRILSDGFHVTNQFIYNLPFGTELFKNLDKHQLENLGLVLWSNTQSELIVTKNAGAISYSYCPLPFSELLDQIDEMLINYYELPNNTLSYLKKFIQQLIVAGRENESQTKFKIKYLEQIN
jgi:type I restriction-modification system DNA methylase subunit